jgi:hypothetical protein
MLVIVMLRQLINGFKLRHSPILGGEQEATHMSAPSKQTKEVGSMRHQDKIKIQRRRRRKFFWLFAAAAVSALLLEEQAVVLYVLLALAISGVVMVLAFSNLVARDAWMQTASIRKAADHDMSRYSRNLIKSRAAA